MENTPITDAAFDSYNTPPYTFGLCDIRKKMQEMERANAYLRDLLRESRTALDHKLLDAWCSNLDARIAAALAND